MLIKKFRNIIYLSILLTVSAQAGWFDNKIEVRKCYDPKKWDNFKQYHEIQVNKRIMGDPTALTRWDWDLDLKKNKAVQIFEIGGKLRMKEHNILKSDNLVTLKQQSGDTTVFDLKKETVFTDPHRFQCVFK